MKRGSAKPNRLLLVALASLSLGPAAWAPPTVARAAPQPIPTVVARVRVAAAPGRFLAWPANNGLWSWDQGR